MRNQCHSPVAALGLLSFAMASHGGAMLAPTLDTRIEGTNSIVYCPTLQVAWDGLERIVGGPIEMQKQNDLLQKLNDASCPTAAVPEDAYVAMAGYADQGIVPKIEAALRKSFGANAPDLPAMLSDKRTVIVMYSYLCRSLRRLFDKLMASQKDRGIDLVNRTKRRTRVAEPEGPGYGSQARRT